MTKHRFSQLATRELKDQIMDRLCETYLWMDNEIAVMNARVLLMLKAEIGGVKFWTGEKSGV